jgi:hypothetical protein
MRHKLNLRRKVLWIGAGLLGASPFVSAQPNTQKFEVAHSQSRPGQEDDLGIITGRPVPGAAPQ